MKNNLITIVSETLSNTKIKKRKAIIDALQSLLYENMYEIAEANAKLKVTECPRCGSTDIVRKGKDQKGSQRYLCNDCRRTFGDGTNRILGQTKLTKEVWMRYLECFADRLSLRVCADRSGVSLTTSFFMRHRIMECIAKFCPSFQVETGSGAEIDEKFFKENFKGNHKKSGFQMPRKVHKRGTARAAGEQICVMTGLNDKNDMFYELAGRGMISIPRARQALKDKIKSGAIISTDKAYAYEKVLKRIRVGSHITHSTASHKLNRINNLHYQIENFMGRYKGVATKHLPSYLAWFKWVYSFKSRGSDISGLLVKQISEGVYRRHICDFKHIKTPYLEYWTWGGGMYSGTSAVHGYVNPALT